MKYDVIIVGMGISGITAAIYAKRSGLNVLMIEKSSPGGILNKISKIENYPGFKSISGPDLAFFLFEQVNYLNINYKIETVNEITNEKEFVILTNKNKYMASNVIIATGRQPLRLGLPNEEKLLGKGISNCALCDGYLYKNQPVAVVGSNAYALEECLVLSNIASLVYLINGTKQLLNNKISKELMTKKNVIIINNAKITSLLEKDNSLKEIIVNHQQKLEIKALFEYLGYKPDVSFLKNYNITNKAGSIKVNEKFLTTIKHLYAIGDAIVKPVYQLITAANDGLVVIQEIKKDFIQKN